MSIDKFFRKDPAEAWAEELERRADEAKALEVAERQRRIAELQSRRAGKRKKDLVAPTTPPAVIPPIIPAGDFKIESFADRYRIHQIQYQNGLYVIDWSKELLDEGNHKTQQQWIDFTQSTEWKIPNMQLYHATLATLYRQRNNPQKEQKKLVKELHRLFKTDFEPGELYMTTSTRIKYAASGQDEVTHDVGYALARKQAVALVGPEKYINTASGLEEQMDVLLGSRNLVEIEQVYEWIGDQKPYLWRYSQAPAQDEERAAVLGSGDGRFSVGCDNVIYNDWPAHGVVASQEGPSPSAQKGMHEGKSLRHARRTKSFCAEGETTPS